MDFRTPINIDRSELDISHRSKILLLGSCFIENMGRLFIENKFDVNLNPFGILYNPKSIAQALCRLIDRRPFTKEDLFEHKGIYHSFSHHSIFSNTDINKCMEGINARFEKSIADLDHADLLIVTFGTAYVFKSKETGLVVGNCHKLPANQFTRYRLNVEDIVSEWMQLIDKLREVNPSLKILFTVSPIRHLKDGAHDNQLSKSVLLLVIEQLCQSRANVHYFPSYEIVLDELRDYRFYNEDMIHPSSTAVNYIWNRFCDTYIRKETVQIMEEWRKICLAINHRAFSTESAEHKSFLRQTLLKLKVFSEKYPYICCRNEIKELENRISKS